MVSQPQTQTPLRRALLLRIGALVLGAAVTVGASLVILGLQPLTTRVNEALFSHATEDIAADLTAKFKPVEDLLLMSLDWLDGRTPSLDSPEEFDRRFQPVLRHLTQVTSVVAGTSSGQGWMLLERPDGGWLSRLSDVPAWGRRHAVVETAKDGSANRAWLDLDYDPRSRPWFAGALAERQPGFHWTKPYTLFTTGDQGITVSARRKLADGRDFVLGFDLTLRDLSRHTMRAHLGRNGHVLVMNEEEAAMALPAPPPGMPEEEWLKRVFQPATGLGIAPVADAIHKWRSQRQPSDRVIGFHSADSDWLMRVVPYSLGQQRLWVVALAPAADFAPNWAWIGATSLAGVLLVVLLGVFPVMAFVRRIAEPLEALAAASRNMGAPDPEAAPGVPTGIAEVEQLAAAQAAVAGMLRNGQEKLENQEVRLQEQIAALKAAELELRENEHHFRTLANSGRALIWTSDTDKRCNYFNEPWLRFTGRKLEQELGNGWLDGVHPDDVAECVATYERAFDARQPFSMDYRLRTVSGEYRWVHDDGVPRYDSQGRFLGYIGYCLDITERKKAEEEIRRLGYFDPLTGLPNRRLLLYRLHQALQASRRSGEFGALLMLDLDNFKLLNDSLGHDSGDRLLTQAAQRLAACLRREDTVSRLGGDEFVLLLEALGADEGAAARQAEHVAEKVRQSLNEPYCIDRRGHEFHCTGSIGLALFGGEDTSAETLLKQADMALYRAKAAGRNAIRFFNPSMQAAIDDRARMEAGLRRALAQNGFVLHYQPQVDPRTRRVAAVEALLRWRQADDRLVPPESFVPVAEETGLIVAMGDWVIEESCRQLAAWRARGIADLRVAVNLSARQLHSAHLPDRIRSVLAFHHLPGDALELEITESTAMHDPEEAQAILESLRRLGVRLAIDDFGTGYSSLIYLRRLPIQTLKLDRSFVGDLEHDENDAAICAAVISLGRDLGLQVVAEGVETEAQRQFLADRHQCDLLQGFLFCPPLPAEDLSPRLLAQAQPPEVSRDGTPA